MKNKPPKGLKKSLQKALKKLTRRIQQLSDNLFPKIFTKTAKLPAKSAKRLRKKLTLLYMSTFALPSERKPLGPHRVFLFNLLSPQYRILPLSGASSESGVIADVWPGARGYSTSPKTNSNDAVTHHYDFPSIQARLFRNVDISAGSSSLLTESTAIIPDYYVHNRHALIEDGALLYSQLDGQAVVRRRQTERIEKGICVFGSGTLNWYHWLIEILPSAAFSRRLDDNFRDFPLLVHEGCLNAASFRQSLSCAAPQATILPLKPQVVYRVSDLLMIDAPATGPMNLLPGVWPRVTDYAQHSESLLCYRDLILSELRIRRKSGKRRIFLARGNGRRAYNQDDLVEIAEGFGFDVIHPENLSFRDQVELFHNCEFLVGASGAAFANLLFCTPGAKALTWVLKQYNEFCCFSNLSAVTGVDLRYLFVSPAEPVSSSFTANSVPYSVDPNIFRAELVSLGL